MTRAEAIEWLKSRKEHYEMDDNAQELAEALEMAIASLETDEAYQLEYEKTTKNDLALIHTEGLDEEIRCTMCTNSMKSDRGCDGSCVVNNAMYKNVMDAIEKRIQPTTRNCFGCKYSKDNHNAGTEECHLCMWENQYTPTTKNDLGVDAVSRQEVLYLVGDYDLSMGQVVRGIHALPSVTPQEPKVGQWREDIDNNRRWDRVRFYCSECGDWQTYGKSHYCPNCGAKMVEPQESESDVQ